MKIILGSIFAGLLMLGGCSWSREKTSPIVWTLTPQEELKIFRATFRVMATPQGELQKKYQLESQKITDELLKSHGCPSECQFSNVGPEGALVMAPNPQIPAVARPTAPQAPVAPAPSSAPPPASQGKK